jgi:hypothetical protein
LPSQYLHILIDNHELRGTGIRGQDIIAQLYNTDRWKDELSAQFNDVATAYVAAMARALPDCKPRDLLYGYQFLLGAMMITFAETGRIHRLAEGHGKADNLEEICGRMTRFVAAGFRGLAAEAR